MGDRNTSHCLHRLLLGRQEVKSQGKNFLFRFDFDSPSHNNFRLARNRPNVRGAWHADELAYFFKYKFYKIPARDSMEFVTGVFTRRQKVGVTCKSVIKRILRNFDRKNR